jgi:heme/copper-type cytochrome/quinol oxidase subunit 4
MNRGLWKELNYLLASFSYLLSIILIVVALRIVAQDGVTPGAVFATLIALYFLQQGVYIVIVSAIVERRRSREPIKFPDRRNAA